MAPTWRSVFKRQTAAQSFGRLGNTQQRNISDRNPGTLCITSSSSYCHYQVGVAEHNHGDKILTSSKMMAFRTMRSKIYPLHSPSTRPN